MRIAILTYHSNNISGPDYAHNDHVALAADLEVLRTRGIRIIPLQEAVTWLLSPSQCVTDDRVVAITFDDGSWFDWFDLPHPTLGAQRGFAGILGDSIAPVSATSFVIASPAARDRLDQTCLIGQGWWTDSWWRSAAAAQIAIENHSWDHNHETLDDASLVCAPPKGQFRNISNVRDADLAIQQARLYINKICAPQSSTLFAYPYGHVAPYLAGEYFPQLQSEILAAFTTEPRPLDPGSDRWQIGRYVCGHHWTSVKDLHRLLDDAFRVSVSVA